MSIYLSGISQPQTAVPVWLCSIGFNIVFSRSRVVIEWDISSTDRNSRVVCFLCRLQHRPLGSTLNPGYSETPLWSDSGFDEGEQ